MPRSYVVQTEKVFDAVAIEDAATVYSDVIDMQVKEPSGWGAFGYEVGADTVTIDWWVSFDYDGDADTATWIQSTSCLLNGSAGSAVKTGATGTAATSVSILPARALRFSATASGAVAAFTGYYTFL